VKNATAKGVLNRFWENACSTAQKIKLTQNKAK
jgi:hypothetical protein